MTIRIVTQIIKERVNNDIFNNIINILDPKKIQEKLCTKCFQVRQRIIYFIFQKHLIYSYNKNSKGFKKSILIIFIDIYFLVKSLQSGITLNRNIWNSITILVVLDFLYNNFETIITNILKHGNKIIKKIKQILTFVEVKFINK